jgi:hypothetical protein
MEKKEMDLHYRMVDKFYRRSYTKVQSHKWQGRPSACGNGASRISGPQTMGWPGGDIFAPVLARESFNAVFF